GFSNMSFEDFP
nr:Chain B, NUMB ASSOCIATE KINASE [Drosophila melanogaster]